MSLWEYIHKMICFGNYFFIKRSKILHEVAFYDYFTSLWHCKSPKDTQKFEISINKILYRYSCSTKYTKTQEIAWWYFKKSQNMVKYCGNRVENSQKIRVTELTYGNRVDRALCYHVGVSPSVIFKLIQQSLLLGKVTMYCFPSFWWCHDSNVALWCHSEVDAIEFLDLSIFT